jgi:hypothetical protein
MEQIIDVMLEKQVGCPRVHRLRVFALLESRQLGFRIEDDGIPPSMQYGSREGRQCVSAVLNKQLIHDIVRHKKSTAAFMENDAVGCYDRMVNNLLLYELQRLGLPLSAVKALSAVWGNA